MVQVYPSLTRDTYYINYAYWKQENYIVSRTSSKKTRRIGTRNLIST